jgi:hypothetical protein
VPFTWYWEHVAVIPKMLVKIYAVKASLLADRGAIEGDPTDEINALRKVKLVVKGGTPYKRP